MILTSRIIARASKQHHHHHRAAKPVELMARKTYNSAKELRAALVMSLFCESPEFVTQRFDLPGIPLADTAVSTIRHFTPVCEQLRVQVRILEVFRSYVTLAHGPLTLLRATCLPDTHPIRPDSEGLQMDIRDLIWHMKITLSSVCPSGGSSGGSATPHGGGVTDWGGMTGELRAAFLLQELMKHLAKTLGILKRAA